MFNTERSAILFSKVARLSNETDLNLNSNLILSDSVVLGNFLNLSPPEFHWLLNNNNTYSTRIFMKIKCDCKI